MGQTVSQYHYHHQKVIITISHGYCPNTEWDPRVCDRTSLRAGKMLKETLDRNGIDSDLIVTDPVLRSEIDFNRKESRDTPMRQYLRKILETSSSTDLILIDIHSYPDKEHFGNAELTLLTPVGIFGWCISLFNYLLQKGVNIKMFPGAIDNDIINEAVHQFQLKKVCLIEFWEYDTSFGVQEKIDLISDFIKSKL